jgi:hypothetical protein
VITRVLYVTVVWCGLPRRASEAQSCGRRDSSSEHAYAGKELIASTGGGGGGDQSQRLVHIPDVQQVIAPVVIVIVIVIVFGGSRCAVRCIASHRIGRIVMGPTLC